MKLVFSLLIVISIKNILAQEITIQDELLNTPVEGATLTSKKFGTTSNKNGMVDISKFNYDDTIKISHVSYCEKYISKKDMKKTIYLLQKTNILPTIFLTGNIKTPIPKRYPVFTVNPLKINQFETSIANLLSSTSEVTVQESQSGGGSPNYRGMEANRLLLVVDGVALNNAIYRSGHLQNSAAINPFFIESIVLLSGPASVQYGNGAMGGALIFKTPTPKNKNGFIYHQQFESSNNSVTSSLQANYYKNKFSHISAFSITTAGNLKMGKNRMHGYKNWGKEATIREEQLYTNYIKADVLHKSNYELNTKNIITINTQYSTSSNIYRFDKMNDMKNGLPKYKHWYYGPQIRLLQSFSYQKKNKTIVWDNITTLIAFQNITESRHTQLTKDTLLNNRHENVKIYDWNIDLKKEIKIAKLNYGIGIRNQKINSTAHLSNNISTFYNSTRYPDGGSSVSDFFGYCQINMPLNKKTDLFVGGRWNNRKLSAKYNDLLFGLSEIKNTNISFVKSVLISVIPKKNIILNAAYYGGFRNPNIDDIGKVFSKDDKNVVIPNLNLEPEYATNFELSVNYIFHSFKMQLQIFNTQISNAISREYGTLNGSDSLIYDGEMMRIQMNKNIENATIKGASLSTEITAEDNFLMSISCNYLIGKNHEGSPLAHIPPFNGKISLDYKLDNHTLAVFSHYNAWKLAKDYDDAGVDNLSEATIDGTPSWHTLNFTYRNKINSNMTFSFTIKNILDLHYKTFASGISASGRNFILTLRTSL